MDTIIAVIVFGIERGAIFAMVGLGLALVYKATGILNFAQGELGTLSAFAAFVVLAGGVNGEASGSAGSLVIASVVAIVVGAILGVLVNVLVIRRLSSASPVLSLVATAGVALFLSSVEVIQFEARARNFPRYIEGGFRIPGTDVNVTWHTVVILIVLLGVAALLAIFFQTPYGIALLATAQEPFAAELQGVPVALMRTLAWGAAGALAALGGVLGAGVFNSISPGLMTTVFLIPAFIGAVLGGISSLQGAIAGGMILGLVVAAANQIVQSFEIEIGGDRIPGAPQIAVFAVLLVVLLVRPSGLLGDRT